jgi:16S rRNA (cytosine967-C5)-methyltransferase
MRSTGACFVREIGLSVLNTRREAFRILRSVEDAGAFASVLLEGSTSRLRDPREAALLTEIVLGVLRRRAPLDHAIAQAATRSLDGIDRDVLEAIRIGAYALLYLERVPDFAAVDTAVALLKEAGHGRAAGFANGVLRRLARERFALLPPPPAVGDVEALALFRSHPVWWTRRLVDRYGWDRAEALLAVNNQPAATVLAPWPGGPASATLAERLAADDVLVAACRFVPGALRVVSGVPQRAEAFREGAFWIQDEASQLSASLFADAVGPLVLDACAAPGGKTLSLAARTREGGLVVAADRSVRRLSRLTRNLERVRARNVVVVACDMSRPAPMAGTFDDVLVDAPCSGTGTLRRHPEIRWRLTPDALPEHGARQRRILSAAADLVRPGGRLVYSVCSMEPEEGEDVIASFLADRPQFAREDPRGGLNDAARTKVGHDFAVRTSSLDDGMDGFFAVLLTCRSH